MMVTPRIGIDFDNTIADYGPSFSTTAADWGWIDPEEPSLPWDKPRIRAAVRALADGEHKWRLLQAEVYGPGMARARMMPGLARFVRTCRARRIPLFIVSHKTLFAGTDTGQQVDLRQAALAWMDAQVFFRPDGLGFSPEALFFEATRAAKIARIGQLECSHFIDDQPELFGDPGFPAGVRPLLFHPGEGPLPDGPFTLFRSWDALFERFFPPP